VQQTPIRDVISQHLTLTTNSCTADIEGNDKEFIFGGKYGYGVANKETGDYRWVKKVWSEDEIKEKKHEKFRGNDGAVDSQGRFWAGFMFDPLVEEMRSDGKLCSNRRHDAIC
jgi:sugar lactone lactonase YvrE